MLKEMEVVVTKLQRRWNQTPFPLRHGSTRPANREDAHHQTAIAGRKLTLKFAPFPILTRAARNTSSTPISRNFSRISQFLLATSSSVISCRGPRLPSSATSANPNNDRTTSNPAHPVQIGQLNSGQLASSRLVQNPVVFNHPRPSGYAPNKGNPSTASKFAPHTADAPSKLGSPHRSAYSAASCGSHRIEFPLSFRASPFDCTQISLLNAARKSAARLSVGNLLGPALIDKLKSQKGKDYASFENHGGTYISLRKEISRVLATQRGAIH
jgi:hypothetical protein